MIYFVIAALDKKKLRNDSYTLKFVSLASKNVSGYVNTETRSAFKLIFLYVEKSSLYYII